MGKMSKAEKIEMEKRALAENRQMMADMMRKTPLEEAAPELLEACKEGVEAMDYLRCFIADHKIPCSDEFKERWVESIARARAAIAKAEPNGRER